MSRRRKRKGQWPSWVNTKEKRLREEAEKIAAFWQDAINSNRWPDIIKEAFDEAMQLVEQKFPSVAGWGYRVDIVTKRCDENPHRVACYNWLASDERFALFKIYLPNVIKHRPELLVSIWLHEIGHHLTLTVLRNKIPPYLRFGDPEGLANGIVALCGYTPKWEDGDWFADTPPNEMVVDLRLEG